MIIDGRSVRAKNIYDGIHKKLVNSAIELFNNPDIENEKCCVGGDWPSNH